MGQEKPMFAHGLRWLHHKQIKSYLQSMAWHLYPRKGVQFPYIASMVFFWTRQAKALRTLSPTPTPSCTQNPLWIQTFLLSKSHHAIRYDYTKFIDMDIPFLSIKTRDLWQLMLKPAQVIYENNQLLTRETHINQTLFYQSNRIEQLDISPSTHLVHDTLAFDL